MGIVGKRYYFIPIYSISLYYLAINCQEIECIRYNSIGNEEPSLMDIFCSEKCVIFATQNEFASTKLLVHEVIRKHGIVLSAVSEASENDTFRKRKQSAFNTRSGPVEKVNSSCCNDIILSINRDITVTSFLGITFTNEEIDVHMMPWMCPIFHWGKQAGEEPIWRCMELSDVVKMATSLVKKSEENCRSFAQPKPLQKSLSTIGLTRSRQPYQTFTKRKIKSGPVKVKKKAKSTKKLSLSIISKKSTKNRPGLGIKRVTRLKDFETKIEKWSQNIMFYLREKVLEKRERIAQAAELERERRFRLLEIKNMSWEDSLSRMIILEEKMNLGLEPPPSPTTGCISFLFPNKHAKIATEHQEYLEILSSIEYHKCLLRNIPDFEQYGVLRHKMFREEELSLYENYPKSVREDSAVYLMEAQGVSCEGRIVLSLQTLMPKKTGKLQRKSFKVEKSLLNHQTPL